MAYHILFWTALVILGIGVVHRIDRWFLLDVGMGDREIPVAERVAAGLDGSARTVFSWRVVKLLKVFLVDVLFQARILRDRRDPLAWIMHVCIFLGFVALLVFHALGTLFGRAIAPVYVPTLNPFMFMRNLSGLLLVLGLVLAALRRVIRRRELPTAAGDVTALVILGCIALSGFLLEATKITSDARFETMVAEFTGGLQPDDVTALRAYWQQDYGLVPSRPVPVHDAAIVARGRQLHAAVCAGCHASPRSAFISYATSRAIAPIAAGIDRVGARTVLWWLHVLACAVGMAYLAYSKMFHIIGTPVSLMVVEAAGPQQARGAAAVRQAIELDGCSHGGACHDDCPVRRRRVDRIGDGDVTVPVLAFLEHKNARELGSRPIHG